MFINREKILNGINIESTQHKLSLSRFLDGVERVLKNHTTEFTKFLSPDLLGDFFYILEGIRDVNYSIFGGYEDSEYSILAVYPDYIEGIELSEFPISMGVIKTKGDMDKITHRDVLGSIMGLGISRDIIGDIIILDDRIQVMLLNEMSDYLFSSLNKIGRQNIEIRIMPTSEFKAKRVEYKSIYTTVKTLRVDALISAAYGLSRSKSSDLIKGKKVKVQYRYINSISKELSEGDMVSVRGYGRFILSEVASKTKKDRVRVTINKVI